MQPAINSRKARLDAFFNRARLRNLDEEIQADLAKHGAVLVCGFVERCVEIVILDRLAYKAHPRVLSFIRSHFKRGTNYDCEPISQLLEKFDSQWAENFRVFVKQNQDVAAELTSAYALRNSIAHGGDANRGLVGVLDLYTAAKKAVDGLVNATK